jgi:hypothetical protein
LIAGAIVFAIYAAMWMEGAAQMRRSISAWADDQRAAGLEVEYDSIATSGFPFFLRGAVRNVSIGAAPDWRWRAPRLYVDALPLAPNRLVFSARDGHEIDAAGAGRWRIEAPDGRASIGSDKLRRWIVDVESGPGRIENSNGESLSAERFLLTVAPAESDHRTLEASLSVSRLIVRTAGAEVAAPTFEAMIALNNPEALEPGSQAWRDAGGGLELRRVYVETGGGKLILTGALAIDEAGRPEGALRVEATKPGAFARLLGDLGAIEMADAEALEASLSLASIAGGGKLKAPLLLEDGYASIIGVKILELPQVYQEAAGAE